MGKVEGLKEYDLLLQFVKLRVIISSNKCWWLCNFIALSYFAVIICIICS